MRNWCKWRMALAIWNANRIATFSAKLPSPAEPLPELETPHDKAAGSWILARLVCPAPRSLRGFTTGRKWLAGFRLAEV